MGARLLLLFAVLLLGCNRSTQEAKLKTFIENHVKLIKPLEKAHKLAYWQAATTGSDSAYKKAAKIELEIRQIYANKKDFEYLKNLKQSKKIKDPLLKRQLTILYNRYLQNQIDPSLLKSMVDLSNQIEERFSTFRPLLFGKKVTNNQILEILKKEHNLQRRRAAWEASKQVGELVATDLIRLVKLRNQAARELGFKNFHQMSLTLSEQNVKKIDDLIWEVGEYTLEPYYQAKVLIDRMLGNTYHIHPRQIRPWHYHDPFFQETPQIFKINLDAFYKNQDIKALALKFYASIGLPVDTILAHSDLYEREGKNPHAFCEDFDHEGDVRILCNLKNNETWMETLLHELGHAVYDTYNDPRLPYLLREPAHIFTTEGVAMLFGRLSRDPNWMEAMLRMSHEERQSIEKELFQYMRLKQLIFARWALVMYYFEKAMYANPDQNLNALWWKLVKKYQLITPPEGRDKPDWAAKIHFTIAPCYYHNYMLGELFASQLHMYITKHILKEKDWLHINYVNHPEIGRFLQEKVFKVGKRYPWEQMIKRATGSPLKVDFFARQFML